MSDYENLHRWKLPEYYIGQRWDHYYSAGVGQNRDSTALDRSNFASMLKALGDETETVTVVRASHWACGWVEWIAIHETDHKALETANEICGALSDYPVIDDEALSEMEWNEAADQWDNMTPRDKVRMAIEERKRYHWFDAMPVWRFGRLDYATLANDGSTIAEALCESLRNSY